MGGAPVGAPPSPRSYSSLRYMDTCTVVVHCDVTERDRARELVELVLRHRLPTTVRRVGEQVGDPRNHVLHEVLVELDPALRPFVARDLVAPVDLAVDARDFRSAPPTALNASVTPHSFACAAVMPMLE